MVVRRRCRPELRFIEDKADLKKIIDVVGAIVTSRLCRWLAFILANGITH